MATYTDLKRYLYVKHKELLENNGLKELINQNEIPKFCIDHIYLEYKHKLKQIKIKLIDNVIEESLEVDDFILFKFVSSHSNDNLVILDKKRKVLFLGDALCGMIVDYDFIKDKDIMIKQLVLLKTLDFDIAVESHNNPIRKNDLIIKLENKIKEIE